MVPKPLYSNKAKMVRAANLFWILLVAAPMWYLVTAAGLEVLGEPGVARDQTFILPLFIGLAVVSAGNIGFTVFFQTSKTVMRARASYDPIGSTFLIMSTSSILSEAHAIYGLVLTLLSGSIFYLVGFSLVAWASLLWVRGRFKQDLAKLPNP